MSIDINRIEKGFDYFWDMKPSEFNEGKKLHLTEFLKLLEPLIEWYKNRPEKQKAATPEDAEEIFGASGRT